MGGVISVLRIFSKDSSSRGGLRPQHVLRPPLVGPRTAPIGSNRFPRLSHDLGRSEEGRRQGGEEREEGQQVGEEGEQTQQEEEVDQPTQRERERERRHDSTLLHFTNTWSTSTQCKGD